MSRRNNSRRIVVDDEEEVKPLAEDEDVKVSSTESQLTDDEEENGDRAPMFSSQAPENSQSVQPARVNERNNFFNLGNVAREKAVSDMSRLVLFKALLGEPIDRLKCTKDAGIDKNERIASAVFEEANVVLKNLFDFELRRMPSWMERLKNAPAKFKDRYYLFNALVDDEGDHSKALHSVHTMAAIEKGLLMIALSLAYCKGEPMSDGSRWIIDKDLYHFLHRLDENIPAEPPTSTSKRRVTLEADGDDLQGATPYVDSLLEKFVYQDYLIRVTKNEHLMQVSQNADENSAFYSMGPRAAIEIGRKQVIHFCAEVLDEGEPDPTMLRELEDDEDEEMAPV